jgi:phosphatidylglycerophosphate synthase
MFTGVGGNEKAIMEAMSSFKRHFPITLTWFRLALAPLCIANACFQGPSIFYCVASALALVTDYFDGALARRWGVVTSFLRRLDSLADTCFYTAILACCFMLEPVALAAHSVGIIAILVMESALYAISYWRFKKPPANHAWLAKFWGLLLPLCTGSLLSFQRPEPFLSLTVWVGMLSELDGLLIISLLPRWQQDISGSLKAWKIRKETLGSI